MVAALNEAKVSKVSVVNCYVKRETFSTAGKPIAPNALAESVTRKTAAFDEAFVKTFETAGHKVKKIIVDCTKKFEDDNAGGITLILVFSAIGRGSADREDVVQADLYVKHPGQDRLVLAGHNWLEGPWSSGPQKEGESFAAGVLKAMQEGGKKTAPTP